MNSSITKSTVSAVREMNSHSTAARALFAWFAARKKASNAMPVRVAAARTGQSEKSIREVFVELEELKCGELIKGTRGHETRMNWTVNIISLAAAARGEVTKVDTAIPAGPTLEDEDISTNHIPADFVSHRFHLRSNVTIELALPPDLSTAEAARLAAFVRSLPFEAETAA